MVVWDSLELSEIVFKGGTSLQYSTRTCVESLVVGVVV